MKRRAVGTLAVILLTAGCGPAATPLGEVEGVVLKDGKPLQEIFVQFLPDPEKGTSGPISEATTDANGRYRLRTADRRDGAVVGAHRVVLEDPNVDRPAQGEPVKSISRVPARYTSAGSTPLKKTVQPGAQVINLEIVGPSRGK